MGAAILIVDDAETVRTQVRNILEGAGFDVQEAINGRDALTKLNKVPETRLILCDLNMPEMDGISMCKEVHKNAAFKTVPIIMLTAETNPELKKTGKLNGVVAWLTKPVNGENLVFAINKILGSR